MNQRILINGCGRIGTRLGLTLADRGAQVYGLRRSTTPLPEPLNTISADVTDERNLTAQLPPALDLVYVILTPDRYDDAGYRASYVAGTQSIVNALKASGNQQARLIFVSSTGVYGQNQGEWVDETSPTEPDRFSGKRLLEAEAIAARHSGSSISVRFGGIYGPDREALRRRVVNGGACQAKPPLYTNRIHEDDCVGILAHLGALADPAAVYIGVDNAPCSQCEVMDWLAEQLGCPAVPRAEGHGTTAGKRCSNRRLLASGYQFRFPDYRAGYSALLNDPRRGV